MNNHKNQCIIQMNPMTGPKKVMADRAVTNDINFTLSDKVNKFIIDIIFFG